MKKKITTIIVIMAMFYMMSISAFAAKSTFSIPANQVWANAVLITRSCSVDYVTVSLSSVYPLKGADNFHKIQVRLTDDWGTVISESEYVVLEEGKGDKKIKILTEYLNLDTVCLQIRGNSNAAAGAVIVYDGN